MKALTPLADRMEGAIFRWRGVFLVFFVALTAFMGWQASHLRVDAGFEKSLPIGHPYIDTFRQYPEFAGANRVFVAVVAREGDLFTPGFFRVLRQVNDDIFFLPGVERAQVQSILMPNVRYIEVVEGGIAGSNVVPAEFTPTPEAFAQVRANIIRSGRLGELVATDFSGAMVSAQLIERDPRTRERLDYIDFAARLEEVRVRAQELALKEGVAVDIHVVGFAKVIGDVAAGAREVVLFFLVSFAVTGVLVYFYGQSARLTLWCLLCSAAAVVWQLGALPLLGFGIDPLSILIPFLVFAIGVSHGVQMMRSYRSGVVEGADSLGAARAAFRQLFIPGGVALITDTIGFVTVYLIPIPMIRELAITASLGVATILITNLFLLPILLSYTKLTPGFVRRVKARRERTERWWGRAAAVASPRLSALVLTLAAGLGVYGWMAADDVPVGDRQAGVPELRQDARYNQDARAIAERFVIGTDVFTVVVEAAPDAVVDPDVMQYVDRLEWHLRNVEGVVSTKSIAGVARAINGWWNEGALVWRVLPRNPEALAQSVSPVETSAGLFSADGSRIPVIAFLADHKAETLQRVAAAAEAFGAANPEAKVRLRLALGNAGVMAATNEVVAAAQMPILLYVFAAVIVLCWISFRSLRATICIVAPLAVVSLLSYAVMGHLQIGLKVSTLPVVSLGVGIGVDYGIYLFSRLQALLAEGRAFPDAMREAVQVTGSAVLFTGLTLAIGVATWVFSDLKFQADMGLLLMFMFLVNMLAAVTVLPALASWFYRART